MNETVIREDNEIEIDLLELFNVVWNSKWAIIFTALVGALIAFALTALFISPTYKSGFTAYVNNHASTEDVQTLNSGDTNASQSLAQTYATIMESRPLIESAARNSGLLEKYEYEQIEECVSTSIQTSTQLVDLTVSMKDPSEALQLAQQLADAAPNYIKNIVEGSSMKIVSSPVMPTTQSSPSMKKNVLIGFLIGGFIAAAIAIIRFFVDDRIRYESELEDKFGIPVIGTIPNFTEGSGTGSNYAYAYGNNK